MNYQALAGVLAMATLGGCVSHVVPSPSNTRAVIRVENSGPPGASIWPLSTCVYRIDDKPLELPRVSDIPLWTRKIDGDQVSPGTHSVEVSVASNTGACTMTKRSTLQFSADASNEYRVLGVTTDHLCAWVQIVKWDTRKVVASSREDCDTDSKAKRPDTAR
jgi:hypothetical protein